MICKSVRRAKIVESTKHSRSGAEEGPSIQRMHWAGSVPCWLLNLVWTDWMQLHLRSLPSNASSPNKVDTMDTPIVNPEVTARVHMRRANTGVHLKQPTAGLEPYSSLPQT